MNPICEECNGRFKRIVVIQDGFKINMCEDCAQKFIERKYR